MSDGYFRIADTPAVKSAQLEYGSRSTQARAEVGRPPSGAEPRDSLTEDERDFLATRDSFYLASVSGTGWPYVQFRGGPSGFVSVLDDHTIGWADFRGNRQYISTGNMADNDRVALFFMDYPHRSRLKIYGRASVVDVRRRPDLQEDLRLPGYRAIIERMVTVTVVSYDWNCPKHIAPRFTVEELDALLGPSWRPQEEGRRSPADGQR